MIVRPATLADLPALLTLAHSAGTGLTTLPADTVRLRHRLEWAEKTFAGDAERADADYLCFLTPTLRAMLDTYRWAPG